MKLLSTTEISTGYVLHKIYVHSSSEYYSQTNTVCH